MGQRNTHNPHQRASGGFTFVELLVAMSVIAVLIGLMIPAISRVTSTANRVVCSSNIRQIGLGVAMYADDSRGVLPRSVFIRDMMDNSSEAMQETIRLRLASDSRLLSEYTERGDDHDGSSPSVISKPTGVWDGLGLLYSLDYLTARGVFYCPSHTGENRLTEAGEQAWKSVGTDLLGNYQYRAEGPDGSNRLWRIDPREAVLVSDSLRRDDELNHEDGANTLRADLAVLWFADSQQELLSFSREGETRRAWALLDQRGRESD